MPFLGSVVSILSAAVSVHAVSVVLRLALAARLSPYLYGVFVLVLLAPEYAEKLFRFGVDDAGIYWGSKDKPAFGVIAWNAHLLTAALSLFPAALIYFTGDAFAAVFLKGADFPDEMALLVACTVPFFFLLRTSGKMLLAAGRVRAFNLYSYVPPAAGLAAALFVTVVFKRGAMLALGAYFGVIAGFAVAALVYFHAGGLFVYRFDAARARDLLAYGMRLYLPNALQYLHYRLDYLLLAGMLSPKEVGLYSVAVSLAEVMRKVPNVVSAVLFPKVAESGASEAGALTARALRHWIWLGVLSVVPFFAAAVYVLLPLVGAEYGPLGAPLAALLPGMIGAGAFQLLSSHAYGSGAPQRVAAAVAVGLVLNIALNVVLIPRWGIVGCAASSSLSYAVVPVLLLAGLRRSESLGWGAFFLPQPGDREDLARLREYVR